MVYEFEALAERVLAEEASAHALDGDNLLFEDLELLQELLPQQDVESDKVSCESDGHQDSGAEDYDDLLQLVTQALEHDIPSQALPPAPVLLNEKQQPVHPSSQPFQSMLPAEVCGVSDNDEVMNTNPFPNSKAITNDSNGTAPHNNGSDHVSSDNFGNYSAHQRRLARNREAAKLSRERRRKHVTKLEQEVAELRRSQAHYQYAASAYFYENMQLRAELQRLQPHLASPPSPFAFSAPNASVAMMATQSPPVTHKISNRTKEITGTSPLSQTLPAPENTGTATATATATTTAPAIKQKTSVTITKVNDHNNDDSNIIERKKANDNIDSPCMDNTNTRSTKTTKSAALDQPAVLTHWGTLPLVSPAPTLCLVFLWLLLALRYSASRNGRHHMAWRQQRQQPGLFSSSRARFSQFFRFLLSDEVTCRNWSSRLLGGGTSMNCNSKLLRGIGHISSSPPHDKFILLARIVEALHHRGLPQATFQQSHRPVEYRQRARYKRRRRRNHSLGYGLQRTL